MVKLNTGICSYIQICSKLQNETGWSVEHTNESAAGTYAYRGSEWISFQDTVTVKAKVNKKYPIKIAK